MGRVVKALLMVIGLMVALVAAIVGYVVATFDPNQYKQRIIDAVREKTERTLKLEGDIRVSFFPSLGMAVSGLSLSEPESDKLFVEARGVHVSLKLIPLLSRRVEVDEVSLKGVTVSVVRSREGKLNFEDLAGAGAAQPVAGQPAPGPSEGAAPAKPDGTPEKEITIHIEGVSVEDGTIDYTDEAEGQRFSISRVNIRTGPIADGVRSHIGLAFALKANEPPLDLAVDLKTGFLAEAGSKQISLTDFDLGLKGGAMGITDLDAMVKGTMEARSAASEVSLSKLNVTAKGRQKEGGFHMKLDIPRLILAGDKVEGDQVSLDALMQRAGEKVEARVKIPGIDGSRKSFSTAPIEVALELEGDGRMLKSNLGSRISGNIEAGTYELPRFTVALNLSDPSMPGSPVQAKIEGAARLDLARQTAEMDFSTQLDESRIEGRVGLVRFDSPAYTFDVRVDQLDVDRYMAKAPAPKAGESTRQGRADEKSGGAGSSRPIDLSGLKGITVDGKFQAGQLKASNIRTTQVLADVKVANGRLDVNPLSASLYGGSLSGSLSAQSASAPSFSVKQRLSGVEMGPLLRDAASNDRLEGRGNISVDLTTQGDTEVALKNGLNGSASLLITDGSVRGIDLAGMLRDAKNRLRELKGQRTVSENKSEKTAFSELKASFSIRNGVAHNNDLMVKSPLLRVTGEGTIDIGNDRIDYLLKPTVVGTSKGRGGHELADLSGVTIPVRIQGPRSDPKYTIDTSGLAMEYGKGLLERAREDLKGQGGRRIEDRLKGILRR
jgi:AsmA protein